jgi:O-succinylbenzoate synthase
MEAARGEWPAPVRDEVPVNVAIPELPAAQAAQMAAESGCRTAKVKVGGYGSTLQDAARVEAVAGALGPGGRVRVDANGAWDVDDAVRALTELELAARRGGIDGLEYVEQPCATVHDLAALRRRVDTPIAADESVRLPGDATAVVEAEAADIIVLKVAPLGGVRACLEIAERAGLPVVVSSALESSVGLAAGIALARALPELPYDCGLGTGLLLKTDTVTETLVPVNGALRARELEVIA